MTEITKQQAKRFILTKQGLIGSCRFTGKKGALDYIRQAGCIQFDPVDVCGKNAELTLQSRVSRFSKQTLQTLLYKDRSLVDYSDKELSIFPTEDWPFFFSYRERSREHGRQFSGLAELEDRAIAYIRKNGPVSSDTLPIKGKIFWHSSMHWSGNWEKDSNAARSVLEQLYTDGILLIHHKNGSRKFYDLAEKYIPEQILNAGDPFEDGSAFIRWRILRRIGAVGLLWNRRSDAFLGISMTNEQRDEAFAALLGNGTIREIRISGFRSPVYMCAADQPLLEQVLAGISDSKPRLEFLAPLDPMLWDRKLISALWDFRYSWEIYTPAAKRKYGFYVLTVLYGEELIGRIEMTADRKNAVLTVRNIWYEDRTRVTKRLESAMERAIRRFAGFSSCSRIDRQDGIQNR